MKKNFAMRIAACLLVVTMLSLCMVSYTYAKYTTADTDNDVAQVAKWGVKVDVQLADLFDPSYDTDDGTVIAAGTYDLFAPGTTDNVAAALTISGQPEVATEVIANATITLTGWEVAGAYYCPIVVKVNDVAVATAATAADYAQNIKDAIEDAINGNYDANDSLAKTVKISWEWPFSTSVANDELDTALGDAAAEGNPAKFGIELTVTVNQVD